MPKHKLKKSSDPVGRPEKKVNWEQFDRLASYQCTQEEIAAEMGIDLDTIANHCLKDFGINFSEFWQQKKRLGRVKIRKVQLTLAEQGSAAAAIWLGKQYLNQTDRAVDELLLEAISKAGITRDQAIEMIMNASKVAAVQGKKTFSQYCVDAGYPAPYPKQIEMYEFGMFETIARILLGARGYGKTDYVVICGIGYDIYCNSKSTNLLITKSKERNTAILGEIETGCVANGVVFEKANAHCLRVAGLHGKDHSVSAVTIKTKSLRGRHPKRAILEDCVTEDDTSEATRLHVERMYNEVTKLTSNILIIGQPAHKFDLYAKVRDIIRKLEVPWGSIPELDHDLEAQRAAGVDEASISASYHLKILPEGATPFDNIKHVDKFSIGDSAVAFIDPSHKGRDFTAVTIMRQYLQGIMIVGFCYRKAWNHAIDEIVPQLKRFNVKRLGFETNALGDMPIAMLRNALKETGIGVTGRDSTTNKHSRIMAAGAFAAQIHLSRESDKVYADQVIKYEYNSKNDDAPDSLATLLEWVGLIRGKV